MKSSPRRELNRTLLKQIAESHKSRAALSRIAGFTHSQALDTILRGEKVSATPLLVARLVRLAAAIGFPSDQIFVDDTAAADRQPSEVAR